MLMAEAGVFENGPRCELLDGVLLEVGESPGHVDLIVLLNRWLAPGFVEGRYFLRLGNPLAVPDPLSLPQPDVAVVEPRLSYGVHPSRAVLVIEVSVTSLRTDLYVKQRKYAAAGVVEYWVIDFNKRQLVVFGDPTPDGYAQREERTAEGTIMPRAVAVEPLDLTALFAGLDAG